MRRAGSVVLGLYLLAAAVTRLVEQAGVTRCHCSQGCWCRRRGWSAFRWVVPLRHR